jgi:hypothetical protein
MGLSPRRAGESLSLAWGARHGPRTALLLSLSGNPGGCGENMDERHLQPVIRVSDRNP